MADEVILTPAASYVPQDKNSAKDKPEYKPAVAVDKPEVKPVPKTRTRVRYAIRI